MLPDATAAYLARVKPPVQRTSTTMENKLPVPVTSSVKRDSAYRKATLDILYTMARTGKLPDEALQALIGG